MLNKLLPKEEKYFEDFRSMIAYIDEMAHHVHNLFSLPEVDKEILLKIKPLELRCDELSYKIIKRLNKTFITPFDREDIFTLVKRLDDISDMLLAASLRVDILNITNKVNYAAELSSIVLEQIKELGKALIDLKSKHVNELKAVKDLESEADKVYHQAIKELFSDAKDAITLIKEKEVLDLLEKASDKCQAASNIILAIFLKNA
jgi:hypothetical protein